MYEAWQSYQIAMPDYCQKNPDEIVDPALVNLLGEGAIYGEGGYNRYTVRISGEVTASRHHASGHKIRMIEEEGIRLY